MPEKGATPEELGKPALVLPRLVNAGLAANARARYSFTLLQGAMGRAGSPEMVHPSPHGEREVAGMEDAGPIHRPVGILTQAIAGFFRCQEEMAGGDLAMLPGAGWGDSIKWSEARRYALLRDRGICQIGGCKGDEPVTVHHILPRTWGGTHHPMNLATLCTGCHNRLCSFCTRLPEYRVPGGTLSGDPTGDHIPVGKWNPGALDHGPPRDNGEQSDQARAAAGPGIIRS